MLFHGVLRAARWTARGGSRRRGLVMARSARACWAGGSSPPRPAPRRSPPILHSWVGASAAICTCWRGYGSTEAGAVFVDGHIQRPPVIDYKLVDVPDLGYFRTDRPHPRGELLVKSEQMFPGYYKRPEITAEVFDADGYYRTGDIVAELGPDQRAIPGPPQQRAQALAGRVRRRFQVGSRLRRQPAGAADLRLRQQRAFLPAGRRRAHDDACPLLATASDQRSRCRTRPAPRICSPTRCPRDFIVETTPFTLENGLLTGIRKLARPNSRTHYGQRLEQLYTELAEGQANELRELRRSGADAPVIDTVSRAAGALLGAAASDVAPDAHFTDLGGDSLSALTFSNLLHEIFAVDVPRRRDRQPGHRPGRSSPATSKRSASGSKRPTYASVHGRDATEVHARDLTLDKFLDADTLAAAPSLPEAADRGPHGAAHRRHRLPRPLPGPGMAGAHGPGRRQGHLPSSAPRATPRPAPASTPRSTAGTRNCWRTTRIWPPSTLRSSQATRARPISASTTRHLAAAGRCRRPDRRPGRTGQPRAAVQPDVRRATSSAPPSSSASRSPRRSSRSSTSRPSAWPGASSPVRSSRTPISASISPTRQVDDTYANGYGNSKWAGEVLLREAHDLVSVCRSRCSVAT